MKHCNMVTLEPKNVPSQVPLSQQLKIYNVIHLVDMKYNMKEKMYKNFVNNENKKNYSLFIEKNTGSFLGAFHMIENIFFLMIGSMILHTGKT